MKTEVLRSYTLTSQEVEVLRLRGNGFTFKKIGESVGVSECRAASIFRRAKIESEVSPDWTKGLEIRACACLCNAGITSREEAIEAYTSGRLSPHIYPRNYGWKSHQRVAEWLGLPIPEKKILTVNCSCPNCGHKFKIP